LPVPLFPALDNKVSDLLSSFPDRGLAVAAAAGTGNVKTTTLFKKKASKVSAQTGLSIKNDVIPVDLDVNVSTSNKCTAELSSSDFIKGANVRVQSRTGKSGETKFQAEGTFANEQVAGGVEFNINFDKRELESVQGHGVFKYPDQIYWGARGTFKKDILKLEGTAVVNLDNSSYAQFNLSKKSNLVVGGLSWYHIFSDSVTYASTFTFDVNAPKKGRKGTKAALGGCWKLDEDTTFLGKWDISQSPEGNIGQLRISLAAQQRVTSYCVASVGVNLNASKFLGRSDAKGKDHNFGFQLAFE